VAPLLLQVRVHVLNDELIGAFRRLFPKLGSNAEQRSRLFTRLGADRPDRQTTIQRANVWGAFGCQSVPACVRIRPRRRRPDRFYFDSASPMYQLGLG